MPRSAREQVRENPRYSLVWGGHASWGFEADEANKEVCLCLTTV